MDRLDYRRKMRKNNIILLLVGTLIIMLFASNALTYLVLQKKIESISYQKVRFSTENNIQVEKEPQKSEHFKRFMPIVAVSTDGIGSIGDVNVEIINGDGDILINANPFLEPDLQFSVTKAVAVAKSKTTNNSDIDLIFDFTTNSQLIGGESAGAAITIATIAAIESKNLNSEAVITGTINQDGTIGKIGAVKEKAQAVAEAGYKYFLIPENQSIINYYEKELVKETSSQGKEVLRTSYVPKTLDLKEHAKKEWNLEIIEVADINEAIPYFID